MSRSRQPSSLVEGPSSRTTGPSALDRRGAAAGPTRRRPADPRRRGGHSKARLARRGRPDRRQVLGPAVPWPPVAAASSARASRGPLPSAPSPTPAHKAGRSPSGLDPAERPRMAVRPTCGRRLALRRSGPLVVQPRHSARAISASASPPAALEGRSHSRSSAAAAAGAGPAANPCPEQAHHPSHVSAATLQGPRITRSAHRPSWSQARRTAALSPSRSGPHASREAGVSWAWSPPTARTTSATSRGRRPASRWARMRSSRSRSSGADFRGVTGRAG